VLLGVLGFFAIGRPIRNRRRRDLAQLNEAKSAAQDDPHRAQLGDHRQRH
jgi:hypothetical protein